MKTVRILATAVVSLGLVAGAASAASADEAPHREVVCHYTPGNTHAVPPAQASDHMEKHERDFLLDAVYGPDDDGKWDEVKDGYNTQCLAAEPTDPPPGETSVPPVLPKASVRMDCDGQPVTSSVAQVTVHLDNTAWGEAVFIRVAGVPGLDADGDPLAVLAFGTWDQSYSMPAGATWHVIARLEGTGPRGEGPVLADVTLVNTCTPAAVVVTPPPVTKPAPKPAVKPVVKPVKHVVAKPAAPSPRTVVRASQRASVETVASPVPAELAYTGFDPRLSIIGLLLLALGTTLTVAAKRGARL